MCVFLVHFLFLFLIPICLVFTCLSVFSKKEKKKAWGWGGGGGGEDPAGDERGKTVMRIYCINVNFSYKKNCVCIYGLETSHREH